MVKRSAFSNAPTKGNDGSDRQSWKPIIEKQKKKKKIKEKRTKRKKTHQQHKVKWVKPVYECLWVCVCVSNWMHSKVQWVRCVCFDFNCFDLSQSANRNVEDKKQVKHVCRCHQIKSNCAIYALLFLLIYLKCSNSKTIIIVLPVCVCVGLCVCRCLCQCTYNTLNCVEDLFSLFLRTFYVHRKQEF